MASVVKRRRKDGTPSYFVKYRDGNRRTRWEQLDRAKDANTRKAAVERTCLFKPNPMLPAHFQ